MVPHFFRTLLQRSAKLSKWTLVAEAQVELLRFAYCLGIAAKVAPTSAQQIDRAQLPIPLRANETD
jgi:hypothetical protein